MEYIVCIFEIKTFEMSQFFFRDSYMSVWAYKSHDWWDRSYYSWQSFLWFRRQGGEKLAALIGTILSVISDCFLFRLFSLLLIVCGWLWGVLLSKTCEESNVLVGILCCAADALYLNQNYEQGSSYEKSRLFLYLVGPSKTRKSQLNNVWLKKGTCETKFDKN